MADKGLITEPSLLSLWAENVDWEAQLFPEVSADVATSWGDAEVFPDCLRVIWADLSMMISRQQEQCKLRDKSQQ